MICSRYARAVLFAEWVWAYLSPPTDRSRIIHRTEQLDPHNFMISSRSLGADVPIRDLYDDLHDVQYIKYGRDLRGTALGHMLAG